jgi:hypothetical protein
LKTNLGRAVANVWLVLSEVPGWPDAPLGIRLRRVAPILVALVAAFILVGWKFGWREPELQEIRVLHSSVVALEEEVAALGMECSDQRAAEVAEQARAAMDSMLASHDEVTVQLRQLREQMRALGWDAVFQAYDASMAEARGAAGVEFASARGRLVPITGNPAPFRTLLGVFDQISAGPKRIDLIRLGVRADEPGKLEVELNLRIACRAPHEKTS